MGCVEIQSGKSSKLMQKYVFIQRYERKYLIIMWHIELETILYFH